MEAETIKTDSFTMRYFKFGRGKAALAIIPGLSVQSVMRFADDIAEAYRLLADAYTVYVFDRKPELPAIYPVSEMAQDTADALRALDLHRVSLLGASQGGMIAMTMAIRQLDLVQNLVLCSTSARLTDARFQMIQKWIQLAKAGKAEDLYLAFGEAIYPRNVFEQSRELLIEAAQAVTEEDLSRFVILAEGLKSFDVADDLEKIACPVFAVGSKDDRVLGADATLQLVRSIGVSNFRVTHLRELMAGGNVAPVLDQMEHHPYLQDAETLAFCRENDIVYEAWSPLGRGGCLDDPVIGEIARAHGASPAQIIIAWHVQHGVIPLPRSKNPERIRANARMLVEPLTEAEMASINALDKGKPVIEGIDPANFAPYLNSLSSLF